MNTFRNDPMPRRLGLPILAGLLLVLAPLAAHAGDHTASRRGAPSGWSSGYSVADDDSEFGWSLFDPSNGSSTCNTNGDDWQDIQRALRDEKDEVFWFRLDDRRYVIRDRALVARASEIVAPMQELGKRQGELGARQGALGAKQGALGARQGQLGARQAAMSARLARAALLAGDDEDGLSRRERREIEDAMRELGEMQRELGRQQVPLGRLQAELGQQQGELGRQQAKEAARAGVELRRLAEEAIRDGKALPLRTRRSI
jgi:bla regulator protein BlaR1